MADKSEQIKPKRLSALAQLVECLKLLDGITSTAELAEATGYTKRAIRKAKAELECRNPGSARKRNAGTGVPKAEPGFRGTDRAIAHANKELPNGNTSYEDTVIPFYAREGDCRVKKDRGTIVLCDELKEFWLREFSDQELYLALRQAAGYCQANSGDALEIQVSRQLSKYAREKLERQQRYESAKRKSGVQATEDALRELEECARQMEAAR